MAFARALAVIANRHREKVVLKIGVFNARAAADKTTGFELIACTQTGTREKPSGADVRFAEQVVKLVNGHRLQAFHLYINFNVVLQISANAGKRVRRRDFHFLEVVCWPDAGEHQ